MTNSLAGRRGVWLRQFGDSSERTLPAILQSMQTWGRFDLLCLKVMDGVDWVGGYDPNTPVQSLADLADVQRQCIAAGVQFCPVVNPRGYTNRNEAETHAQIADTCGALVIDIEQGKGYWDQSPLSLVPVYFKTLRATTAAFTYLCAQPDPRPGATAVIPLDELAPYVDAFAAQHYVGFDAGWRDVGLEVQRVQGIKALGRDTYITLWGLGDLDAAGQFWSAVRSDVLGFQVFAFGAMNAAQLAWAATLQDPVQAQPPKKTMTNDDIVQTERFLLAEPPDIAAAIDYLTPFR